MDLTSSFSRFVYDRSNASRWDELAFWDILMEKLHDYLEKKTIIVNVGG